MERISIHAIEKAIAFCADKGSRAIARIVASSQKPKTTASIETKRPAGNGETAARRDCRSIPNAGMTRRRKEMHVEYTIQIRAVSTTRSSTMKLANPCLGLHQAMAA